MRKFKLTNSRGEEYDLMSREHFFYKPTGLGAAVKTETLRAGSDWIKVNTESTQKKIGGQMVFKGYSGYSEFVTFCSFEPIYFWYCPQSEWHYLECELTSIAKSELDLSRRLYCAVTFTGFGAWRGKVTYRRSAIETDTAKRYPVKYTYQYSGGSMGVINISNSGTVPAPVKLRIFGPCDDPRWVLSNSTGVVTSGRVFAHIAADELLVVDPNPRTMSITVCSAVDLTPIREIYDCSDFSTGRFLFAPSGNSIISVSQSGSLWDICSRSLTVYDVAVDAKLDIQARQLRFTIGAVSGVKTIEAGLPNCLDKTFTITDTFGGLNKVIYINKNDESQHATFYLYTDGTIGSDDRDRITPVFFKYEYIQSSDDFYATAASRAAETLMPKKHNNLIELTYATEDKLVKPNELQIGQTVEIIHDGISYSSMLTGWERTDNLIHLVFGSVRLDLTKILELERRNGNAS